MDATNIVDSTDDINKAKKKAKQSFYQGTTFRLLRRIQSDHKLLFWGFIITLSLGGALYVIKLVYFLDVHLFHWLSDAGRERLHHVLPELEHIDFAGITVGFAGILIAVVITLVVEERKEVEDANLSKAIYQLNTATISNQSALAQLNTATTTTQSIANEILSKYTALSMKNTLPQRVESITNIIKLCERTNNHLYILNYSANGGYVECHNANVIIDEGRKLENIDKPRERPNRLSNVDIYDFHKWYNYLRNDRDRINNEILELARKEQGSNRVHFAVLKTKPVIDLPGENKYKRLLDRIFRQETIVAYDSNANSKMPAAGEHVQSWDIFVLPDEHAPTDAEKLREKFIDNLVKRNVREIDRLEKAGVTIHKLNHIPFQFYASIPPNSDTSMSMEQCCLIEFTNIHAIGERAGIVAFESRNPDVINSLKDVFDKVLNEQNRKIAPDYVPVDPNDRKVYELFDLGRTKVNFVIKRKDIAVPGEDTNGYNAEVDRTCAEDIKELLWAKMKIEHYPDTVSCEKAREDIGRTLADRNSNTDKTYFCVGIFGNELTDWLSSQKAFFHIETTAEEKRLKHISIRTNGAQEWLSLEIDPSNEDYDVGLITKIVLDDFTTVIVIGGMTGLGTEQLGKFVKNNWQQIYDAHDSHNPELNVGKHEFVMLFDVKKSNSIDVTVKPDYVYVKSKSSKK